MTLDCKPRRIYPPRLSSLQHRSPRPLPIEHHSNGESSPQQLYTRSKVSERKRNTGESFLKRLMDIERKHDEKKNRQKAAVQPDPMTTNPALDRDQNFSFPRSPTRWLSEQIFDDTKDCENITDREVLPYDKTIPSNKSVCDRLPTLSQMRRSSSCTDVSSSHIRPADQLDYQTNSLSSISYVEFHQSSEFQSDVPVRKRPLRLPPILMPPIYAVQPRPLKERDFLTPTKVPGPITDEEWEDLRQCRYLRPAPPRYALPMTSSSQMSLF